MHRLEGRTAIVTGGGSAGFGRAIARRIAGEGAHAVIADLDEAGGTETVRQLEELSESHGTTLVVADVSIQCDDATGR
jgi:NAD(P)-dependent dehydrogenase (short-subunit alcohol dehydrogenase family)